MKSRTLSNQWKQIGILTLVLLMVVLAVAACGGTTATTVGATAVGPSVVTLREHPELVDRAAAQGRAVYCWNVDRIEDVHFCRDVGAAWIATHHPGRTKAWLQNGLAGAGCD